MSAMRLWRIAALVLGLVTLGVLIAFSQLPAVASAYPAGAFGPALSAFQRAADMNDLVALFGNPPDPAKLAAMNAGNQLDLFGFIPAYTLFLIAASIALAGDAKKPLVWVAIMLALIAATADVMETSGQLGIGTDWARADMYLRYVAPAAWMKFFALGAHALACSAICVTSAPPRRIIALIGLVPILGVFAASTNLVHIPSLMATVFGAFWVVLLAVVAMDLLKPRPAPAPSAPA
jgi:hypothetical protein